MDEKILHSSAVTKKNLEIQALSTLAHWRKYLIELWNHLGWNWPQDVNPHTHTWNGANIIKNYYQSFYESVKLWYSMTEKSKQYLYSKQLKHIYSTTDISLTYM